jgi:predicted lipid-binding transport protein (Tim44 family)
MRPRRRVLLLLTVAALILLAALAVAPAAMASAGGGTGGFGGGGGGGGFSGGGGGGGGKGFAIYLIFRALFQIALLGHGLGLLFLIALGLIIWFLRSGLPKMQANFTARRESGQAQRRRTRQRERKVELAAAEAADEDDRFDPEHVRASAAALFNQIQFAWDAGDRIRLRGLIAPALLTEWERRLDEFDRQGWRNRVEPLEEPKVEYVGLARGGPKDDARVVVRIESRMRDYVVDRSGRHIKRRGQFTETVRLREYWTLQQRDGHWVLASIEQGAEGAHALQDKIVQTEWADEGALRDEAMVEQAAADAVPDGTRIAEVASLEFSGDARSAANDLSLADGRFAPDVLEIAARRAVAAWADAVDGPDQKLRAMAEPVALADLLYAGDHAGRTRVVVRGPEVTAIKIVALDPAHEPPTMTIDVGIRGRRYVQDRNTTQILSGSSTRVTSFTERWTLALTDDPQQPWRITQVGTPATA